MAGPIQISTVVKIIQTCVNKGQTASSNLDTCIRLTNSLSMAVEILQHIQSNNHLTTEAREKVDRLLQRLSVVTSEVNDQFDQCQSDNISGKISTFLHASSIKDKLGKLQDELQNIMSMLTLLLHVGKPEVSDKWIKASDGKEPPNQDQRVPCKWGLNCRNIRDNQHCNKYSHPTSVQSQDVKQIPCKWGEKCYDHNDSHRAKYSHPQGNTQQ
jgi:hypothetical protein